MATRKRQPHDLGAPVGRKGSHAIGKGRSRRAAVSGARGRAATFGRKATEVTSRYSMLIRWSELDQVFIVTLPEFDDAKTHGATYASAVKQGKSLIESFFIWYAQDNRPLPEPRLFNDEMPPDSETRKLVGVA